MKLSTEFQSRSYDAMVSHTTIVFTRYILLKWIRRNRNDQATIISADITELLKSKVDNWMKSQPLFIQALFGDLCWEN